MTGKFKGWCIDSGATSHVCNDGDLFKCMDSSLKENIKVANGDYLSPRVAENVFYQSASGVKSEISL